MTYHPQPVTRPQVAVREDRESGQSDGRTVACGAKAKATLTDQTELTRPEV